MSLIDNNNTLLREDAGKGKFDVITTSEAVIDKDYYRVHFPIATTIISITLPNAASGSLNGISVVANTTLKMRVTGLTIEAGGVAICYTENDGDTSN
tara:strand:- start:245 stop:535 length:291 start_codon:yes stop_codon:yes gene_type:complete